MKGEITIQNFSPKNLQIICRFKSTIQKQKPKKSSLRKLRCGYREIPKIMIKNRYCEYKQIIEISVIKNKNVLLSHYKKYFATFPNITYSQQDILSQSTIEEKIAKKNCIQDPNWKRKRKEQKLNLLNDPIAMSLLNEYRASCSNNIMKNIKEGFIRHIIQSGNQKYFESLVDNQMTFQQMKRKLLNLKQLTRENKVIKIICKHNHMKILFKDFLERAENEWLVNSKIQQKEQSLTIIKFLLKIIEQIEYIDVIEDYKK